MQNERKNTAGAVDFLTRGEVIDEKYEIIEPIAEGGMGVVYRAYHRFMRKEVAIKRLHPELLGHKQVEPRFEREAQAAARIEHPNVCEVKDCGRDKQGAFYIVMELLEGESLQDTIDREGSIDIVRTLKITSQICDGLYKAHSMGIIHRDLKPDNIMLVKKEGERDWVKIMDFGIAKIISDRSTGGSLTQAGMIFGTPHFLSPEQAAGEEIDHRSDLYSLGIILFYMLTGKKPFESDNATNLLRKHISQPPPLLKEVAPEKFFPEGIQPLVSRLLAKNPNHRPQDARIVKDYITSIMDSTKAHQHHIESESSVSVQMDSDEISQSHPQFQEKLPLEKDELYLQPPKSKLEGVYSKVLHQIQDSKKLKLIISSGIVLTIAAVFILILMLTRTFSTEKEKPLEVASNPRAKFAKIEHERALFNEKTEIKQVLYLLIDDRDKEALRLLNKLRRKEQFSGNPHLFYYLAQTQMKTALVNDALESIKICLQIEPDYRYDPSVGSMLIEILKTAKETRTRRDAGELLINNANLQMIEMLDEIARTDERRFLRKIAIEAIEKSKLKNKLPQWKKLAIELLNPSVKCEQKRQNFSKLKNLNNKQLIPTLKILIDGEMCGQISCSECLGTQLEEKYITLSGN